MALFISHLRRWFAGGTIALLVLVAGVYFYARHRVQNALKQVPEKIAVEIKQSATGFTVSRSEQGHTLFKVEASKAVQFLEGGHTTLHDVAITVYGRDSSRYDQIYGSDFDYDPRSGDVSAKGEVQIDLEANPEGLLNPDQARPRELKNPIHLKTSGLVFNQKTGNAYTKEKVEFRLPQASGSAVGITYIAKTNVLTLESEVKVASSAQSGPSITAERAFIAKDPHQVVLEHPQLSTPGRKSESQEATLFLRSDNTLNRVLATGNVLIQAESTQQHGQIRAQRLELIMARRAGVLQTAVLSGEVKAGVSGKQSTEAQAGRVVLDFAGKNLITKVHAEDGVKLAQHPSSGAPGSAQDLELTAPVVDFFLAQGTRLDRAETSGAAQITLGPGSPNGSETLVTAGKFEARFAGSNHLSSVHGSPDARIVSKNPGQPDRSSASQTLDAVFRPGGGIESLVQEGSVAYTDGELKAWGEHARYTPADQILLLTGSPRVLQGGMTTTSRSMRLNRATGDAFAEGDVKSTYSDLKPQPGGALLASSSPIHVTARFMTVHGTPAMALYTGDVRLWQEASIIEAPSIEFDRDRRAMVAHGSGTQAVSTVLVESDNTGNATPIALTSSRLTYTDSERRAHFDEDVTARGADVIITARQMDAFLQPRGPAVAASASSGGKLDKIVASGKVLVTQPGRRATGEQLVYTAGEDKFVLTGGPPSIFDAERGEITGVSLTLYRHDDRVLVEGNNSSPAVTQTRVAR